MEFLYGGKSASMQEFEGLFPAEYSLLKDHPEIEGTFVADGDVLKFSHGDFTPIFIDIHKILETHRQYFFKNSYYNEKLARALGIKKGKPRGSVCDATAGMLGDTLLMSCFEINRLDAYERHPIPAALITNALKHAESCFNFHPFSVLEAQNAYDVIFFDPMYEDKNTKSAPKKEMQIFRQVIGADEDATEVAKNLLTRCKDRLVIKRPAKSKPLLEGFSHQIMGKSTRYDVYLNV